MNARYGFLKEICDKYSVSHSIQFIISENKNLKKLGVLSEPKQTSKESIRSDIR